MPPPMQSKADAKRLHPATAGLTHVGEAKVEAPLPAGSSTQQVHEVSLSQGSAGGSAAGQTDQLLEPAAAPCCVARMKAIYDSLDMQQRREVYMRIDELSSKDGLPGLRELADTIFQNGPSN